MLNLISFASDSERYKFEYIYEKYKRLLRARAYDILKDYPLAEDAVSEAYLRAYKHLHKIGDPDSPQTASFLVTIVKNLAINMYHREKRSTPVDITEYDKPDEFNLEESVTSKDDTAMAMELVGRLREEYRAVFLLKYAHELSHKEIAATLGITENNVTVRLHRAKTKLLEWAKEVAI
ncbi:MAG: sigma-70 family RNA polymerase sigma factor [Defluviitaleaceae bacterium]|nr:sigma-70 family RNA polymerase sigma factor [Defluviitaleaceae bacterium]